MKFTEFEYVRPNLDEVKLEYFKATSVIQASYSVDDIKREIDRITKIRNDISTMMTIASIRHSVDTTDPFYEAEQNYFDEYSPLYQNLDFELSKVLAKSKFRKELEKIYGKQWFRLIDASLRTFSEAIIPLMQEENKLTTEYTKLMASAKLEFAGKELNLSQIRPYTVSSDRGVRKDAEAVVAEFFENNETKFDDIYDKLVSLRVEKAKMLGFDNFVDYAYLSLGRTDYNKDMVANYRKQVLEDLVAVASRLHQDKIERLGISDPKSYDYTVSFKNGNPKPIGDKDYLVAQAKKMYSELSKETEEFFNFMVDGGLLDLEAKAGKAPGGYCTYIANYKSPFIFANFNGTLGDVDVLTHEAGHAFQVFSSRDFEIPEYSFPTLEACEIHSMSMEFFAWPWMELFFGSDADRYRYHHLAETINFIPYGVLVDHFQTEVYLNPELSKDERKALWRKLEKQYNPHKEYENEFLDKGTFWYRQTHIFQAPFYYIDYTLAQVSAHEYWIKSREDLSSAWDSYLRLCEQGGSQSYLELLEVAGLANPFIDGTIKNQVPKLLEFLDNFDKTKLV